MNLSNRSPLGPRRRRSSLRSQSGGTLIEVLIAAILVLIVALELTVFFARGRFLFDREEAKREATLIAQQALESAVAQEYDDVAGWTATHTVAGTTYSTLVTVVENAPSNSMKTVRAEVTWPSTATATRSVALTTLVYNSGAP